MTWDSAAAGGLHGNTTVYCISWGAGRKQMVLSQVFTEVSLVEGLYRGEGIHTER